MKKLCLKKWGNKRNVELSISFVSAQKIRALNRKYRKINKPTDVLSFSLLEGKTSNVNPARLAMGDIVICPEIIVRGLEKYGRSFEEQLKFLLIHGFLHLLGYDHERSKKEEKRMQRKEREYMQYLGSDPKGI